ncbi:MAG: ABC transporter substrate-binding protein [Henriciella sp.]|nr:ABC transporter substrate-binding protein [Henriciella sp.]
MFRLTFLVALFGLVACDRPASVGSSPTERPMRIVSLDFCADQYVLKLADREQILALSPDAEKEFSFMRTEAEGVPAVRPLAEDVLILKPDLVVRSYGGGPNAGAMFERAGIPVLQVGWASSVHGDDVGSIPSVINGVAEGLGQSERGERLVQEFTTRLNQLNANASRKSTLYMTPAGVTTGGKTMMHEMLQAAGLNNFMDKPGWHSLPLEYLAYERPELVAAAYYDTQTNHENVWSPSRHPIAKRELAETQRVDLEGAWLSCGGWFLLEAIEALAEGAARDD